MRHNMIFHPWLHPQDLLLDPGLALKLDTFLALVAQKRERGELEVMTMGELATVLTGEALRRSPAMAASIGIVDQVPIAD
jgi:hypothetical protein